MKTMKNFLILAAGKSKRFGRNKLEEKFCGYTLPALAAYYAYVNGAENIYLTLSKEGVTTDGNSVYHPVLENVKEALSSFLVYEDDKKPNLHVAFQSPDVYGPGAALMEWAGVLTEPFTLLFGDNLYYPPSFDCPFRKNRQREVIYTYRYLDVSPRNLQLAAVLKGNILKEKPHSEVSGRFFCGLVQFPENFASHVSNLRKSDRGEIELTDIINSFARSAAPLEDYCEDWSDLTYEGDAPRIRAMVEALVDERKLRI